MYTRIRTRNLYVPQSTDVTTKGVTANEIVNGTFCPYQAPTFGSSSVTVVYPMRYSQDTMSDIKMPPRPKDKRYTRRNPNVPRPVKACNHVGKKLKSSSEDMTFVHKSFGIGLCSESLTASCSANPMAWLSKRYGPDYVKEHFLDLVPNSVAGTTFTQPDWFALMSEFNEQLEQLIPSNFFLGESLYEGGIFVDALKLVINPKKAVIGLIKDVAERKLKHLNLQQLDHYYLALLKGKKGVGRSIQESAVDFGLTKHYLKEGINADLLYKFGVRPAIQDIKSTIQSHSKVEERLLYLNKNRGRYVPIRVRKKIGFSSTEYGTGTGTLSIETKLREQYSVASIFGMGRVRTDINQASRWRAYTEYFGVNKALGTVWELTPFSFVTDWFTNFQERINEFTRIRLGAGPFMGLAAVGSSVRNVMNYDIVIYPGYDYTEGMDLIQPNTPSPISRVEVSDYTRYPYIPDTSGVVDMSTLGLFQGVTLGELLIQKIV